VTSPTNNIIEVSLISKITHELRTPLTGILGMIHFLHQTSLSATQKQYLDILSLSAQRLLAFGKELEKMPELQSKVGAP
jgi:signal transduction histidine kinase